MASESKKAETPPYPSFTTFTSVIKGLRETGIPDRIDKSVLGKLSGSAQAAIFPALKWLDLIDASGVPTKKLEALVNAEESQYSEVLKSILESQYAFVTDGSINLAKASGGQVEQKFREYGITGSTVIKCVAFFILAAKAAKFELGPHVKAPKAPASNGSKKRAKKTADDGSAEVDDGEGEGEDEETGIPETMEGFIKIPIPLHGMDDGAIFLPDGLSKSQWLYAMKMAKFLIENYRPDEPDEEKP